MKLSPIENKSKNKTRKETKTYNTGFVCGLLVFGDLSAFPQSQENTHTTFSLLSRRAWWFGWELSPQAQTLEHTVPSGRRRSRRMEVQPSWRKYVTGGGLWEFKSQTTSGSLSLLLPAGIWGCALPLPVSTTVPALPALAAGGHTSLYPLHDELLYLWTPKPRWTHSSHSCWCLWCCVTVTEKY